MKATEFAYWLQGMFELTDPKALDEKQTECIRRHLALVFKHEIDPSYPDTAALSAIHNPPKVEPKPESTSMHVEPHHNPGLLLRC